MCEKGSPAETLLLEQLSAVCNYDTVRLLQGMNHGLTTNSGYMALQFKKWIFT